MRSISNLNCNPYEYFFFFFFSFFQIFIFVKKNSSNSLYDVLQESIVRHVNEHPHAGWKAAMNPSFSNYSVSFYLLNIILLLMDGIWFFFFLNVQSFFYF